MAFHILGILILLATSWCFDRFCPGAGKENFGINALMKIDPYLLFAGAVILAPLLETFIFQAFPYRLFLSAFKTKHRFCIYMIASSLFFGLFHRYNLPYFFFGVASGFILSFFYYAGTFRKESAVISVAFIHGMNNLLVFLSNDSFHSMN